MEFRIEERPRGDVVVLDIFGNLDVQTVPSFKVKLDALVSFGHHRIVINLTGVDFIDSTGAGSLMYAQRMVNPLVGGLRVIGLSSRNSNVFSVLHLTDALSIMKSEDVAISSFHQDGSTIH